DAIDVVGPERRDQLAVARQHDGEHEMHAPVRQDLARYQPVLDGKYVRPAEAQDIEGEFVEAESVMGLRGAVALDRNDRTGVRQSDRNERRITPAVPFDGDILRNATGKRHRHETTLQQ